MAERPVPSEEVLPGVHMPLLIRPSGAPGRWDEDHIWFTSSDVRLQGIDRRPLRYSNLELIPRADHERKNASWDSVIFPETKEQYFKATLFGVLQYIPETILDLAGPEPVERYTTTEDKKFIRDNGFQRIQRGTRWYIGTYFARYIIEHGLSAIKDTVEVSQFLEEPDLSVQQMQCFSVIRRAAEVVLDDIEPAYEVARKKGAIRSPQPTALRFLMQHFDNRQPDYAPAITQELRAA